MTDPPIPPRVAADAAVLFEAAGLGTWSWDRARDEAVWSPLMERLHGLPPGGFGGPVAAFLALVHPSDRDGVAAALPASLESGTSLALEYRVRLPDGSLRWIRGWGRVPRDDRGEATGLLGVAMDVTERKAAEAERGRLLADIAAERSLLEATLEHLPVGVVIAAAATGRVALANARMDDLLGAAADSAALPPLRDAAGNPLPPEANPLHRAITTGEATGGVEVRLTKPDGTPATLLVKAAPIRGADGVIVAGVATFDDVTERRRADERRAFLAEASEFLAASLGDDSTLGRLAAAAVPTLADLCIIDLVEDGTTRTAAIAGARAPAVHALDAAFPPGRAGGNQLVVAALQSGAVQWEPALDDAALARLATDPRHLELLRALGPTACVCVPLRTRGRVLGAVTLMMAESGRHLDGEDRRLADEFARRVALAVDNTRLFAAEQAARRQAEATTERMACLQQLTAALATATTADEVAAIILDEGVAALGARAGLLATVEPERQVLQIVRSAGYPVGLTEPWRETPLEAPVALAEAARTGRPVLAGDPAAVAARYPEIAAALAETGDGAIAAVPIRSGSETLAVIGLSFAEPRPFAAEARAMMAAVAHQSALALERARLYEAERAARGQAEAAEQRGRREAARLVALANLSRAFVEAGPDYDTAIDAVARITADHTGDCCVVRLVSDDGRWADLVALHHPDPVEEARFREIAPQRQTVDEGFSAVVRETAAPLLVPDVATVAAASWFAPDDRDRLAAVGLRGLLVVPLRARGRHLGTLALLRDRADTPLTEDDAAFTQELADRAALAIDNARLYQEARAAVRARDEFLSVAAHELRTPVTTVKGYAQMLLRSQHRAISPARTMQFLSAIDEATDRLKLLAEDLLDVSRLRLGQLPLHRRETDLVALAAAAVERFAEQLGERHPVTLAVIGAPAPVSADPDRIDQILSNLIDNAAKYSPEGGEIAVTVADRVGVGPDEAGVLLTVRDQGIGLPAGEAETIFEPFSRATNAARENLPGLGLGLSICRSLAERHGGRIWAESAGEGAGTLFSLWLPLDEQIGDRG